MFEEKTRDLSIAKSKSILKNKLQIEQSASATGQPDAIVIDGCAILWVVHWPSKRRVQDLVTNFVKYVKGKLKGGTRVHVIFDRYCEYSKVELDALIKHRFLESISCVSALLCLLNKLLCHKKQHNS